MVYDKKINPHGESSTLIVIMQQFNFLSDFSLSRWGFILVVVLIIFLRNPSLDVTSGVIREPSWWLHRIGSPGVMQFSFFSTLTRGSSTFFFFSGWWAAVSTVSLAVGAQGRIVIVMTCNPQQGTPVIRSVYDKNRTHARTMGDVAHVKDCCKHFYPLMRCIFIYCIHYMKSSKAYFNEEKPNLFVIHIIYLLT